MGVEQPVECAETRIAVLWILVRGTRSDCPGKILVPVRIICATYETDSSLVPGYQHFVAERCRVVELSRAACIAYYKGIHVRVAEFLYIGRFDVDMQPACRRTVAGIVDKG